MHARGRNGAIGELRRRLAGKHAVVIGRSNLFGKPMARLLLAADATVTVCHRHTISLPDICRRLRCSSCGRPRGASPGRLGEAGAVVIDVGINRTTAVSSATLHLTRQPGWPRRSHPCQRCRADDDRLSLAQHITRRARRIRDHMSPEPVRWVRQYTPSGRRGPVSSSQDVVRSTRGGRGSQL